MGLGVFYLSSVHLKDSMMSTDGLAEPEPQLTHSLIHIKAFNWTAALIPVSCQYSQHHNIYRLPTVYQLSDIFGTS